MGKGTNTTTQQSTPNPAAMQSYLSLMNQAAGVAATPYTPYTGQLVAPVNAQQNLGISNINANAGYAMPAIGEALGIAGANAQPISASDIQQYVNPWTQNVVNATQAEFANQNAQQMQQVRGNAISQGAFGGNREAVAEAETANQQQLAQAPVIAGLESQGYTQGVNTALTEQQAGLGAAQGIGSLGVAGENAALTGANAQVGAGTLEQQTQQAQDQAAYQQFLNQLAYPFQTTQWLSGIDTGVGSQMGGTSTTTAPAPSIFGQLAGVGTAGVGVLGGTGAFGSAGWLAPAVAALARGGGVTADGVGNRLPTLPESPRTLRLQQHQLVAGHRRAVMFPHGTRELPLSPGMSRLEVHGEVVHFNPRAISAAEVRRMVESGHEHKLLDLGPFSKHEIMHRIAGGEIPLAVVERHPDGTEARAAAGTHMTAHHQLAAMHRTKSPGHYVGLEDPRFTIAARFHHHHRADGGGVPGFDTGGMAAMPYAAAAGPYGGAKLWMPSSQITHGRGAPPPPAPYQDPTMANLQQQAKSIGQVANTLSRQNNQPQPTNILPSGVGGATSPVGTIEPMGISPAVSDPLGGGPYRRGGVVPHYDDGGDVEGGELGEVFAPHDLAWAGIPTGTDDIKIPSDAGWGGMPTPARSDAEWAGVAAPPTAPTSPSDAEWVGAPTGIATPAAAEDVPLPRPRPTDLTPSGVAYSAPAPAWKMPDAPSTLPRGLRNNNPLNIENGQFAATQPGYVGAEPQGRFATFSSPSAGFNAASNLLASYGDKGINTVNGVVSRWSPASDGNDTKGYANFVATQLGVDPNQPLDMNDPKVRTGLAQAMAQYENGTRGGPGGGGVALAMRGDTMSDAPMPGVAAAGETTRPGHTPTGVTPAGIDLSGGSKMWPALMSAGFGMMASRSPFPGVAIGEGGLAGMATYAEEKKEETQAKQAQSRIDLEARRLSDEMDRHRETLAQQTKYQGAEIGIRQQEQATRAAAEQSLADWRNRGNYKPTGRETVDGHPIMSDAYTGKTIDSVTGQPLTAGVQTRPAKGNYKPTGKETMDGHPILYDAAHPGTAIDGVTGMEVPPEAKVQTARRSAGAIEALADRLMEENRSQRQANPSVPEMSFNEALTLAHRAPDEDRETIRRLTLAQNAWKAWTGIPENMSKRDAPEGNLEYWEKRFGVSPAAGAQPAAPGTTTPAKPAPSAQTAPAQTTGPPRPATVPAGAKLQQNKRTGEYRWLAPDGRSYSQDGRPITAAANP